MTKIESILGSCLLGLMGLVLLFFILLNVGLWLLKPSKKKSVFTGFAFASIINYQLEVYEDSTYRLVTLGSETGRRTWTMRNDTLMLLKDGNICATFFDEKLVERFCQDHYVLDNMSYKSFSSPEYVTFPKY